MEEILKGLASATALAVEAAAVVLIAYGALESLIIVVGQRLGLMARSQHWRRDLFAQFGGWLLLGLQYALAADIVRSVISPTWNDIGQLGAIAVIRTFLNYFLERDLSELERGQTQESPAASGEAPAR
jgi:uncharacterized membrane protein